MSASGTVEGLIVRATPLGDATDRTLVVIAPAATSAALAVVLDLSDSAAAATAALVARLPTLLRGWDRAMPVWVYTLGDAEPIADAAGTVGDVIDGALDLRAVTNDPPRLARAAVRGSFAGPTLAAIARRQDDTGVSRCHVVLLGDGRLSDFAPAETVPADLLGLVERQSDARAAAGRWAEVVGGRPLVGFDDAACPAWFAERRPHAGPGVRVHASGAAVLHADGALRPMPAGGTSVGRNPLRLLISTTDLSAITVSVGGTSPAPLATLLATAGPAEVADVSLARAAIAAGPSGPAALVDSAAPTADAAALWRAAAAAFVAAATHARWADLPDLRPLLPGDAVGPVLCLTSREPTGPFAPDDRVVVLAVKPHLTWSAGDPLPIGTAADAFSLTYDPYEDRWRRTPPGVELHPTGSERLPPVRTAEGGTWTVIFSGPLR